MKLYITAVLKKYNKKQQEIADALGISLQSVRQAVYRNTISFSTLEKYASVVGCDVREFFFDPNSQDNPFSGNAKSEKVVSTFISNGSKYKIVEIEN